ncbi:hypothetical protein [Rhizobium laguerreae]|uniref:Uncharacterized protein n=1 Tax=Rhizobium laguerreae TaxID=1076926 RepID=A0A7Y2R312_9HYPH|nr:hypothetical protein [Rhizobium laguerreae]NNH63278.1 hypothetical protein [Rhizobium laguerreae]
MSPGQPFTFPSPGKPVPLANTAGQYRWPVPLDYGDPMRRRLQLRAVRVFSASGREMMERRHDDDIAIGP